MSEYLHLDFRPAAAGWIARLQTMARTIRGRVGKRLVALLQDLQEQVSQADDLDELLEGGCVFTPSDPGILYDLCDAIDSLYFESRSAYEITGRFVRLFCDVILDRPVSEEELVEVLRASGQDVEWISELRENRKLFFHETAPWIALQIHSRDPLKFQLVAMKEDLHEFDDPEKFITQTDMVRVWDGYQASLVALTTWLAALIADAR